MTEKPNPSRFLLIDGLRGVAATMVMLYHFHFALRDEVASWLTQAQLAGRAAQGYLHGYRWSKQKRRWRGPEFSAYTSPFDGSSGLRSHRR